MQKGKSLCKCGSILPELHAALKETLKETTKVAKRKNKIMRDLSIQKGTEYQTARQHYQKSLKHSQVVWQSEKDTDHRKCVRAGKQPRVRNGGNLGPNCKWTSETSQHDAAAKTSAIWKSVVHCSDRSRRIPHDAHASTSRTWTSLPRSHGLVHAAGDRWPSRKFLFTSTVIANVL